MRSPWLVFLTFIACFAIGYIGSRIERHRWSTKWRAWDAGDDDDFEPPESLFGLTLVKWHLQYVRGYSRIKQALFCRWHRLVPVPGGSVRIEGIFVGTNDQLVEPIPADFLSPEAFGARLSLPIAEPGMVIRIVFHNTSKFQLHVETMALCRTGGFDGMMPMPFSAVDLAPDETLTASAQPVKPVSIERLLVSIPKYLPKPKH